MSGGSWPDGWLITDDPTGRLYEGHVLAGPFSSWTDTVRARMGMERVCRGTFSIVDNRRDEAVWSA